MYDGNTVILELDGNGAEKARNVYGRNLIAREVDGVTAIYRYNGHGDVITIMGTDGTAISSYEYDEFGNETASTGTFDNPYRYAGYEYLDEVELYDLNARYYDPSIARFLTEDPYYNLGNRVMGVYEINVPNVYSIMQDNSSDHGPNNSHYSGGYNERKTDSYQLRLIVDYNLDLDCFVSEAVRLNTDNMIYGDNPVKINERENPYNPNNSVTFAYSPNISVVLQSGNLYDYCRNNPVLLTDRNGKSAAGDVLKTGLSFSGILSQLDSPIPGPMDVLAGVVAGVTLIAAGTVFIVDSVVSDDNKEKDSSSDKNSNTEQNTNSKDKDWRLKGKPGEINTDRNRQTKIGDDGKAIRERHYTDHGNPTKHTVPHDHDIKWENGHPNFSAPINYPNGAPTFK